MLSAVIVGVTIGVQNQKSVEGASNQGTWNSGWIGGRLRLYVTVMAPTRASFNITPAQHHWGNHAWWSVSVTANSGYRVVGQSSARVEAWWDQDPAGTEIDHTISWSGAALAASGDQRHVTITVEQIPLPTNVTTTATLRRTDTNATTPWSNTGAPNLSVTINALTWLGTPTPPANHSFDGWSPATRTVNRGNGTNHGILDFTPIFTPLAPTIHLARFYLHGGNIAGQTEFYDVPQIDGMRTPQPRNPQKDGYAFRGWFTEQHGGDPFNFLQPKTSNQTIHAQWESHTQGIIYLHFAGGLAHNDTIWHFNTEHPHTLRLPSAEIMNQRPPVSGQVFLGWFDNMERVGEAVTEIAFGASGVQNFFARWG